MAATRNGEFAWRETHGALRVVHHELFQVRGACHTPKSAGSNSSNSTGAEWKPKPGNTTSRAPKVNVVRCFQCYNY